jgi:subtilisin family serine protease
MSVRKIVLAVAALALAACSEPITSPRAAAPSLAKASTAATASAGRYIVTLGGSGAALQERVQALGGNVLFLHEGAGIATVSGISAGALASLKAVRGVSAVEADEQFSIDDPVIDGFAPEAADASDIAPASTANPAAATRYARQWNMRAVQANLAWAAPQRFLGSSSVTVAILDSGIDYLHDDLNGLVDLSRSVSLLGKFDVPKRDAAGHPILGPDGNPILVEFSEDDTVTKYFATRNKATDLFFHGTHVAATVSSNAVRAAGVTSKTTLMAVKVCAYINTCPFSSVIDGLLYAVDNGADVVNMSLGGAFSKAGNGRFVGLINSTFNYARSKGVTIVVAAGNAGADLQHNGNVYATYCDTPATICVSATGPQSAGPAAIGPFPNFDMPALYTNYGNTIDLAAPGGNYALNAAGQTVSIASVWAACSQTTMQPTLLACRTAPSFIVSSVGTSMASPHVAGAAALLVEQLGRDPAAIRARLLQSADQDLDGTLWDFNGNSAVFGKGRLNVARAVGAI